ncbi:MAG: rRNA pseudouridine synthase [Raineya sp.]|nr:rRNA pseudouridine synthase [Raineya sp.]
MRKKTQVPKETSHKKPLQKPKKSEKSPIQTPTYHFKTYAQKQKEKSSKGIKNAERKEKTTIRLNRFIANAGVCSRREADELIKQGEIKVNGKVVTEMGFQVKPNDVVTYKGKVLKRQKFVYVLLNKPKNCITTTEDENARRTVMDLVKDACNERIYPVGRLDRNTTGLLLLTNDGELARKLSHPSSNIKKVYQITLDKPITEEDFLQLEKGLELEDGFIKPDAVALLEPNVLGMELHSGRNRIVRRMFEHLGYEVTKLDRTMYAGLTKKDLPRGKWRYLTQQEVIRLKFLMKGGK